MTDHEAQLQALIAFGIVWLIQKAKASGLGLFKHISEENPILSRGLSVFAAFAMGAGFTYEWKGVGDAGYQLVLGVPHLSDAVHVVVSTGYQLIVQEGFYKAVFKKRAAVGDGGGGE